MRYTRRLLFVLIGVATTSFGQAPEPHREFYFGSSADQARNSAAMMSWLIDRLHCKVSAVPQNLTPVLASFVQQRPVLAIPAGIRPGSTLSPRQCGSVQTREIIRLEVLANAKAQGANTPPRLAVKILR
jgi:hypothetical protein